MEDEIDEHAEAQAFIDAEIANGVRQSCDLAEASQYESHQFRVSGPRETGQCELTLKSLDAQTANGTARASVRKDPFSMNFRGDAEPILPHGIYKLTAVGSDPLFELLVFIKPTDVWPEENAAFYEVLIN